MTTWYVASHNPGTSSFLDTNLVAVNFWVRASAQNLDVAGVKTVAAGGHPEWDRKGRGVKTSFARQLVEFGLEIEDGDTVITFDATTRDLVIVGAVAGPYRTRIRPLSPTIPTSVPSSGPARSTATSFPMVVRASPACG